MIGMRGYGEKCGDRRDGVYQNENRCERDQRELKERRHALILLSKLFQKSSSVSRPLSTS